MIQLWPRSSIHKLYTFFPCSALDIIASGEYSQESLGLKSWAAFGANNLTRKKIFRTCQKDLNDLVGSEGTARTCLVCVARQRSQYRAGLKAGNT